MISISVGIPTFNESRNIKGLIQSILSQDLSDFALDRIIVSDDNSTDGTQDIVSGLKSKKVKLLKNRERGGVAKRLNQIFNACESDYLLILNGDVQINDFLLIKKMLTDIEKSSIDLLSGDLRESRTKGLIGNTLLIARKAKDILYESADGGDNWYTCHGPIRMFSKRLYKKINIPFSFGEDMYSYFYCKYVGYTYGYTKNVYVLFKQPEEIGDHLKQSSRFFESMKLIEQEFGKEFVDKYKPTIRPDALAKCVIYLMSHPINMCIYLLCIMYVRIRLLINNKNSNKTDIWSIANSSKNE